MSNRAPDDGSPKEPYGPDEDASSGVSWPADRSWLWFLAFPLVALAVVGPMLGAALGPIDDHEIPTLLGPDGNLPWTEVPGTIVRWAAEANRVRPVYWVVRVVEAATWGMNATGWYLDRVVLLLISMGAAAALAGRYVAAPYAALAGLLVVAGPQAESWFRLGPQESIGTPLLLAGLALLAWRRTRPGLVLLVLAALTKEAFVPFALAGAFIGWRRGDRVGSLVACLVILAVGAWIGYLHLVAPDLYLQPRSIRDVRVTVVGWGWTTAFVMLWPVVCAIALLLGWRPRWQLAIVALGLVLTEAYLYAGVSQGRYLLPVALLAVGATIAALAAVADRSRSLAVVLAVAVAVAASYGLWEQRATAERSAASTMRWAAGIQSLRAALASDPTARIVVVPRSPWDYEGTFSLRRHVPEGQAMVAPAINGARTTLERHLQQRLEEVSRLGWVDERDPTIMYAPREASPDCIAVEFRTTDKPSPCPRTIVVPTR